MHHGELLVNKSFWNGKKVLITGHTGFKGSWLSLYLQYFGAEVIGISLAPPTNPSLYEKANVSEGITSLRQDIRDLEAVKNIFQLHKPEIVFHMAAQALVRYSYLNPVETYETNVMGTMNILEGIRSINTVRAAVRGASGVSMTSSASTCVSSTITSSTVSSTISSLISDIVFSF